MLLDASWQEEVYDIIFSYSNDIDRLNYKIERRPGFYDSNHRWVCVHIDSDFPNEKGCHRINLNTYSITRIHSCEGDFVRDSLARYGEDDGRQVGDRQAQHYVVEELFPVDVYTLSDRAKVKLDGVVEAVGREGVKKITVVGIADSTGPYARNKFLAQKRMEQVVLYLQSAGFGREVQYVTRAAVENSAKSRERRMKQRRFVISVEH